MKYGGGKYGSVKYGVSLVVNIVITAGVQQSSTGTKSSSVSVNITTGVQQSATYSYDKTIRKTGIVSISNGINQTLYFIKYGRSPPFIDTVGITMHITSSSAPIVNILIYQGIQQTVNGFKRAVKASTMQLGVEQTYTSIKISKAVIRCSQGIQQGLTYITDKRRRVSSENIIISNGINVLLNCKKNTTGIVTISNEANINALYLKGRVYYVEQEYDSEATGSTVHNYITASNKNIYYISAQNNKYNVSTTLNFNYNVIAVNNVNNDITVIKDSNINEVVTIVQHISR